MLVIDSSTVLGALLPDEVGTDLDTLFEQYDEILAPWLLWAEVRNILIVAERRGRVAGGMVEEILEALHDLGIALEQTPRSAAVLRLARRHKLSVYDALYLELALHQEADLATHDKELRRAAVAEGVRLALGQDGPDNSGADTDTSESGGEGTRRAWTRDDLHRG